MGNTITFHGHSLHPEPWLAALQTRIIGPEGERVRVRNLLPKVRGEPASAVILRSSVGNIIREQDMDAAPPGVVHARYVVGRTTKIL